MRRKPGAIVEGRHSSGTGPRGIALPERVARRPRTTSGLVYPSRSTIPGRSETPLRLPRTSPPSPAQHCAAGCSIGLHAIGRPSPALTAAFVIATSRSRLAPWRPRTRSLRAGAGECLATEGRSRGEPRRVAPQPNRSPGLTAQGLHPSPIRLVMMGPTVKRDVPATVGIPSLVNCQSRYGGRAPVRHHRHSLRRGRAVWGETSHLCDPRGDRAAASLLTVLS